MKQFVNTTAVTVTKLPGVDNGVVEASLTKKAIEKTGDYLRELRKIW